MNDICFHDLFADVGGVYQKTLQRGDTLFHQGDSAGQVFSVALGELQLLRYTSDGHAVCLHRAGVGEGFAEASLFFETYHCNGEATKTTVVWCYPRAGVLQRIEHEPRCTRQFYQLLAGQVRHLRLLMELRSLRSAAERILQYLRLQADQYNEVHLSSSLLDLASELGLAHETLYRNLSELEKKGLLQRFEGRIRLLASSTNRDMP